MKKAIRFISIGITLALIFVLSSYISVTIVKEYEIC